MFILAYGFLSLALFFIGVMIGVTNAGEAAMYEYEMTEPAADYFDALEDVEHRIGLLIETLEDNGNINDVSGLYTALDIIDSTRRAARG